MYTRILGALTCAVCLLPVPCLAAQTLGSSPEAGTLQERLLVPRPQPGQAAETAAIPGRPISLQEAVDIAIENNHVLRGAFEDMGIAGEDRRIARSLFFPQVTGKLAYDWTARQRAMVLGIPLIPPISAGETQFRRAELNVMMTVWDFGRTLGTYSQARLGQEISNLAYRSARRQVIFQVVNAYFNVLRAQRGTVIAEESLTQAQEHLETAQSFERHGVVDRNDVLQAQVQVAEVKQMLIKATNACDLATSVLNSVLGVNVNYPTKVIDEASFSPFALRLDECLELAVDNRPEFDLVQKNIAIQQEGIRVARAGRLPHIYAASRYSWSDDAYQKFSTSGGGIHSDNLMAELGIQIDIYSGGRMSARVRKAKRNLAKAEEKAKAVCDGISLEVKAAFLAIQEAVERIHVARQAVAQAEENLRLINNKYRQSVATSTDVLDAETLRTRSKQNYYTALYDYNVATAQLESAAGIEIPTKDAQVPSANSPNATGPGGERE